MSETIWVMDSEYDEDQKRYAVDEHEEEPIEDDDEEAWATFLELEHHYSTTNRLLAEH